MNEKRVLRVFPQHELPLEMATQTCAIVAMKGGGKTYTASVLAEEFYNNGVPFVIIDPTGAWWGLRSSADGKSEGLAVTIIGGAHADIPIDEFSGKVIADLVVDHPSFYVLDFSSFDSQSAQDKYATEFGRHFYRRKQSKRFAVHLIIDEADVVVPETPGKNQKAMLDAYDTIVRRGRLFGIGVTLITQRPAVISKNVLTSAEVLICLKISGIDQDAVDRHWIKRNGTAEQRAEMLASLASLQKGEAWLWSPSWLQVFKRVKARERETFNSSATPEVGKTIIVPKKFAPVDIAALGEKIRLAVESEKANDPAELKKRLSQMEGELAKARAMTPSTPKPEVIVEKIPALEDGEKKLIGKILGNVQHFADAVNRAGLQLDRLETMKDALLDEVCRLRTILEGKLARIINHKGAAEPNANTAGQTLKIEKARFMPQMTAGAVPDTELSKGAREVLKAIASEPDGATEKQIAVLTGYKKTSRNVFRQELARKGYVQAGGRGMMTTQAGIDALGKDYTPLPTGDELREHYMRHLTGGELTLFKIYVEAYPHPVSNETIEQKSGYKKTSTNVFRQGLMARNLVEKGNGGFVAGGNLWT